MEGKSIGTKCVRGRGYLDPTSGAFVIPIYQSSIFLFPEGSQLKPRGRPVKYSREDNPTVLEVESKIACLENGPDALLFSSGMAATSALIFSKLKAGSEIVVPLDLYGVTIHFLRSLQKFGIKVKITDPGTENLINGITANTKLVFFESMSNPILTIYDIETISKKVERIGSFLAVDNTFATPINLRPLEHGVDLVIHSATKYLNGHNDIVAGAVVSDQKVTNEIWEWRRCLGGCLDPHSAFLLDRGLKTLEIRVLKQNESASRLTAFLTASDKVKSVYYPGLDTHPQHDIAKKYLRGYGGVISFEIDGDLRATMRFMKRLKVVRRAPSLGGTESLIVHPATSSHKDLSQEERNKLGITDHLVRLSVGLEDIDDIIDDIGQALAKT